MLTLAVVAAFALAMPLAPTAQATDETARDSNDSRLHLGAGRLAKFSVGVFKGLDADRETLVT
jgi:hypothetical protein